MSFSNLSKLKTGTDQPKWVDLHDVVLDPAGPVGLLVLPAAEINRPYWNAVMSSAAARPTRRQAGKITDAMIREARCADARIFARHVVKGWRNVRDDAGKEPELTTDEVEAFLVSLIDQAPDQWEIFRMFVTDLSNWRPALAEVETKAGN